MNEQPVQLTDMMRASSNVTFGVRRRADLRPAGYTVELDGGDQVTVTSPGGGTSAVALIDVGSAVDLAGKVWDLIDDILDDGGGGGGGGGSGDEITVTVKGAGKRKVTITIN